MHLLILNVPLPPPVLGGLAGVAIWLCHAVLPWLSVEFRGQAVLAVCLAGSGAAIEAVGIAAFFRSGTTVNPLHPERASTLVTSGLYRLSRNPMYLGMACLLTAWCLYLGTVPGLIVIVGFVVCIEIHQIKPEEEALECVFGVEYVAYKTRVRRWI